MKRFGLLFLLSASYAGLLTLVFSTDYSRDNSFLLSNSPANSVAKAFESPSEATSDVLTDRIAMLKTEANQQTHPANAAPSNAQQSPEGAGH